ncbi:MAG: hypothetical protein N3E39_00720 [Candidatus Methanomethylicia archaeon]|nr:hypothetical protein [Candidatus Methanomethylicia archaeon]
MKILNYKEILGNLRGEKIKYYLVKGELKLLRPDLYPHKKDELPILCETSETLPVDEGYTSGFRSIIKVYDEYVVKLKGIGIPFANVKPIYKNGKIHTYYFKSEFIGTGQLIWGFMTPEEAEIEIENMFKLKDLGIPAPESIGLGLYENIKLLELNNRYELANKIAEGGKEWLLNMLEKSEKNTRGSCIFYKNISDIRVDEILYGLLIPKVENVINVKEVKAYLKWLGSSCGFNLRILHDNGIIHGTIFDSTGMGIYTNSHLANHVVGFDNTYITDFHLTKELKGKELEKMKLEEYYALWHVMNPLPSAEKFVLHQVKRSTILNMPEIFSQTHPVDGFQMFDEVMSIHGGYYRPTNVYEEFTESLIDGIEYGYNKLKKYEVEGKLKRKMLIALSILKKFFLEIYGLPKGMERGREAIGIVMNMKKINEKELKTKINEIKGLIAELL